MSEDIIFVYYVKFIEKDFSLPRQLKYKTHQILTIYRKSYNKKQAKKQYLEKKWNTSKQKSFTYERKGRMKFYTD